MNIENRFPKVEIINNVILPNMETGPWLAGGSVRKLICGDFGEYDYDVFFANEQQRLDWLERIRRDFQVCTEKTNANNTTLTISYKSRSYQLQAIHIAYYETAKAVIDSFDFTICQFITDGKELLCGEYSLYDLARKRLAVNKISYAASSVRRMIKYSKQGFFVCQGCVVELLNSVVANPTIINEQVISVD